MELAFVYGLASGFIGWYTTGRLYLKYPKENHWTWVHNQQIVVIGLICLLFLASVTLDVEFVALAAACFVGYLLRVYWIVVQHNDGESEYE